MWRCTVQYIQTARHQNCNWKNVRCSTILQYFFKSRSWRHFYAVIRERLAENCRGRTTTIICTRTNAPKYILESHRLHFGSICDQNGRNFEPCLVLPELFIIVLCVLKHFLTFLDLWHKWVWGVIYDYGGPNDPWPFFISHLRMGDILSFAIYRYKFSPR